MKKPGPRVLFAVTVSAVLCACDPEPVPADPRLLATLDSTLIPNRTDFVTDGELVTGLYFIVDSGYGYPRKTPHERSFIDPQPIITAGNFLHIRTDRGLEGGEMIAFDMDPIGAARWQVATRKSIQKRVALVVRDVVISSPIVVDEIPGGRASFFPGMGSSTTAEQFVRLLSEDRDVIEPVR